MITYKQRKELNELSQEIYGHTSTWYNKLYKRGVHKTDYATEPIRVSTVRWLTSYEQVKEHMLEVKANSEKLMEQMKANAAKV